MTSVTDGFGNLRGEMHGLFDQIEESEFGEEFKSKLDNIWDTWNVVEKLSKELNE